MELKPCPFCGSDAETATIYLPETPSRDAGTVRIIRCSRCSAVVERLRLEAVITSWNTRTNKKWSMEKLKPCPFCGGPAEVEGPSFAGDLFHVRCQRFTADTEENSRARAIKTWNRRVSEK